MSGLDVLANGALTWAMTYAIHSSVLLGLAAILTGTFVRREGWRETLWKGALLGAVLTATLATALPLEPLGGRLAAPRVASGPAPAHSRLGAASDAAASTGPEFRAGRRGGVGPELGLVPAGDGVASRVRGAEPPPAPDVGVAGAGWWGGLLVAWAAVAGVLLGILLYRNVRLFRALRGRAPIAQGPLPGLLAELRRLGGVWRPVALSVSDACPTPLVIGMSEICIPQRFVTDLDAPQQRAALAHELAHIRRRDTLWQLGTGLLNAVLFFQPLNVLARRRLREAAEHLCDDWAVQQTGSPLALGRCLTAVASWTSTRPVPLLEGTHGIAEGGSPLVHRIRRIARGAPRPDERRLPALATVGLLVAGTAFGAPAAHGGPTGVAFAGSGPSAVSSPSAMANDTTETIRLLERLAMEDPDSRVRQEAAAQLSDFPHPAAAEALAQIVRRAGDPDVRSEAAQQLDEFPTDDVVAVLLAVVFDDPVEAVRFEALDTLAGIFDDYSLASAGDALTRLALEHPLADVRLEAMAARSIDGG